MTNYRVIMEWVHDEKIKYLEKRKIEESASQDVLFLLVKIKKFIARLTFVCVLSTQRKVIS